MNMLARRWIGVLLLSMCLLAPLPAAVAAQSESDGSWISSFWGSEKEYDFSFAGVFPKPIYQKSYFTWLMLGASMVVAGALCYFTAGAGAPAAATGVSTVASTIAGGGAGSYMAGLSIVGGWFGGNAMLGSAILNGIALGLGGGGAAYASLTAIGKVGVLASVTATALDGVLVYLPPDKKELVYRVRLPVPNRIGTRDVENIVDEMNDLETRLVKVSKKIEKAKSDGDDAKQAELEAEAEEIAELKRSLNRGALTEAKAALVEDRDSEDLLVLAILSKNMGEEATYRELLGRIPPWTVKNRSYLNYLKAVAEIENGRLEAATVPLWESWVASPYAVEPALLLVNVLGHGGIAQKETEIRQVIVRAEKDFERDDYASSYSLLALYYRVATMYFMGKRYGDALVYYEKAYDELPWTQKYIGSKQLKNVIRLGMANSLYGQGDRGAADVLFEEVLEDAETEEEKALLQSQYVPNVEPDR